MQVTTKIKFKKDFPPKSAYYSAKQELNFSEVKILVDDILTSIPTGTGKLHNYNLGYLRVFTEVTGDQLSRLLTAVCSAQTYRQGSS